MLCSMDLDTVPRVFIHVCSISPVADYSPTFVSFYLFSKAHFSHRLSADLYAIIKTTEKLEKAFIRDAIPTEEYEIACSKLIQQFRVLRSSLKDEVRSFAASTSVPACNQAPAM